MDLRRPGVVPPLGSGGVPRHLLTVDEHDQRCEGKRLRAGERERTAPGMIGQHAGHHAADCDTRRLVRPTVHRRTRAGATALPGRASIMMVGRRRSAAAERDPRGGGCDGHRSRPDQRTHFQPTIHGAAALSAHRPPMSRRGRQRAAGERALSPTSRDHHVGQAALVAHRAIDPIRGRARPES